MAITVDISKRVVLINSISAACTRILRVTVLVWMYQYLLRRISQDEFAVYALVMAIMVFAPLFSSFFTSGIGRYVVEACARGDEKRATQVVSSIFPVLVGWGLLFTALGWLCAGHVDSFLTVGPEHVADARLMMGLLVTDFALQMMMTPFAAGFAVRQRYFLLNLIEIGVELLRMSILFTLLFGVGTRVIWVVVASVVANLVSVIARTTVSVRLLPALRFKPSLFQWATARQLFSFGLWTTLNQLAGVIHINGDIIVLNKLATAFDVAVFKVGSEFYNQINALVVSTALVPMQPVLTSFHALGARERLGEAVLRSARYILWFSLVMVIPLIVYRRPLIILYAGTAYLTAANVLALLLLLFLFMPAGFLLAPISEAAARMRGLSLANLVIQLVKLSITLYVVRVLGLGAVGCALSTLTVIGLSHLLVLAPMTLRMAGVRWRRYVNEVLAKSLAPGLAGGVVWVLLGSWVGPVCWASLGFCTALGALAYVAALLAFSLNARERSDLRWMFRSLSRKVSAKSKRIPETKPASVLSADDNI